MTESIAAVLMTAFNPRHKTKGLETLARLLLPRLVDAAGGEMLNADEAAAALSVSPFLIRGAKCRGVNPILGKGVGSPKMWPRASVTNYILGLGGEEGYSQVALVQVQASVSRLLTAEPESHWEMAHTEAGRLRPFLGPRMLALSAVKCLMGNPKCTEGWLKSVGLKPRRIGTHKRWLSTEVEAVHAKIKKGAA